jgi:hypothetical protein
VSLRTAYILTKQSPIFEIYLSGREFPANNGESRAAGKTSAARTCTCGIGVGNETDI